MLNSLGGVPQDTVQVVASPLPPVTECGGKQLLLGRCNLHILDKGKFSDIYKVQHDAEVKAFQVGCIDIPQSTIVTTLFPQVHNYPIEWEITILNQLQQRLHNNGLQQLVSCNWLLDFNYG